jgi:DnaJ-domain-containing protein 1
MGGVITLIFTSYSRYSNAMSKPWSTGDYIFLIVSLSLIFGWVIWNVVKLALNSGSTSWDSGIIPNDFKPTKANLFEIYIAAGTAVVVRDPENYSTKFAWIARYLRQNFPDQYYNFSDSYTYSLKRVLQLDSLSTWCNRHLNDKLKIQLIEFLTELAASDGDFIENERQYILFFAKKVKIQISRLNKRVFERLVYTHESTREKTGHPNVKSRYLAILGLKEGATLQEIKSAYRALAKLSHPDRFMNESLHIQEQMKQKFQEIQAAYDALI